MGRQGAEAIPGKPMAHDSGFRWGTDRLPEDFGFRFAPSAEEGAVAPADPPAHPSGFRFAATPAPAKAHPSGFTWADRAPDRGTAKTRPALTPQAFRWADRTEAPVFVWRAPADRAPAFRWKD